MTNPRLVACFLCRFQNKSFKEILELRTPQQFPNGRLGHRLRSYNGASRQAHTGRSLRNGSIRGVHRHRKGDRIVGGSNDAGPTRTGVLNHRGDHLFPLFPVNPYRKVDTGLVKGIGLDAPKSEPAVQDGVYLNSESGVPLILAGLGTPQPMCRQPIEQPFVAALCQIGFCIAP